MSGSVKAGHLGRPHGLGGFIGLYVEPEDLVHFEVGSTVFVDDRPLTVRAIRPADRGHQVAFDEITDRNGAEGIRNRDVMVAERRVLAEGEFWPEQLIGLSVRPTGGTVVAVEYGPGQARLRIQSGNGSFEIPFVEALVPVVDLDAGHIEIVEIEGLIEPSDR